MKKEKVLINFRTYKEVNLWFTGSMLHNRLKNNEKFPDLQPMLEQLLAATEAFRKETARRTTKENKDARRKELVAILTTIARKVEEISEGDIVKIYSAGLNIVKKKPVRPLGAAKNFRVKHMYNGEMQLRCEPNKNAKHYLWEYRQEDGVRWMQEITTAAKILLKGLEIGKFYLFRVMQIGKHEDRTYSHEIKHVVV
jgi:capsule polysaccharide export protein KpsC/LpsZ